MTRSALHPAWRRYRRGWWIFIALWLGLVPGMLALTRLLGPLVGEGRAGVTLTAAWSVAWVVTGVRLWAFECPRCGSRFFERSVFGRTVRGVASRDGPTRPHASGDPA